MPYIRQERRDIFDKELQNIGENLDQKGDLTYCFYKLCCLFLKGRRVSYENLSSVMSCLDDAKQEWYRKKVADYEDKKIEENGDIK